MSQRDTSKSNIISSEEMNDLLDQLQHICQKIREEITDEDEEKIIIPVLEWIDNFNVNEDPFLEAEN